MKRGSKIDKLNFLSTYGALFFGVPNQGMDIRSLIPMVNGQPNHPLICSLGEESEYLRKQHRDFCAAFDFKDSEIVSFYETKLSPTAEKVELLRSPFF